MKIEVLTEEEYFKIKYPTGTWEFHEYLKKQKEETIKRLRDEIEKLEGIIDLKYDKKGNPKFKWIFSGKK